MLFLTPDQRCRSTEGKSVAIFLNEKMRRAYSEVGRPTWNAEADVGRTVDGLEEVAERLLSGGGGGVYGDTDVSVGGLVVSDDSVKLARVLGTRVRRPCPRRRAAVTIVIVSFVYSAPPPIGQRSIVISMPVCVCVCVFVYLRSYLRNYTSDLHQIFCAC